MMHRMTGKNEIRALLNTDRAWSLYALADLDAGMFEQCDWWGTAGGLALVFHGIAIRPIFILGDGEAAERLLGGMAPTDGYLNLRMEQAERAARLFRYRRRNRMCRMVLGDFAPRGGECEALTGMHRGEIERLFATGDGAGIAFAPQQLESGLFRGIRKGGELVAVAGIHVASVNEGVAGVGNVFVREDWRGQGLAQTVLSAVTSAVRDLGISTVGLNVEHTNGPAIRAYERLGFATRFEYYEGPAEITG